MKINLKGPETMYIIQVNFFLNPCLGPYTNFTLYTELWVKIFGKDGGRIELISPLTQLLYLGPQALNQKNKTT